MKVSRDIISARASQLLTIIIRLRQWQLGMGYTMWQAIAQFPGYGLYKFRARDAYIAVHQQVITLRGGQWDINALMNRKNPVRKVLCAPGLYHIHYLGPGNASTVLQDQHKLGDENRVGHIPPSLFLSETLLGGSELLPCPEA